MNVIWTRPALRALEAIGDYISADNPAAAEHTVRRIRERANELRTQPHLGRPGRIADTRELVVPGTPFIVPYRVRDEHVEVLSVFHGARKWPESFR
ncbi:MAG TPA: type II toxin-antitoxin system RelE/ParE family toxin [Xanthobacteraceae bacterium]|nr:type II toxin-antitoxin system RelE/ParE family toxin [Xanthobacteraceae bacterium]